MTERNGGELGATPMVSYKADTGVDDSYESSKAKSKLVVTESAQLDKR